MKSCEITVKGIRKGGEEYDLATIQYMGAVHDCPGRPDVDPHPYPDDEKHKVGSGKLCWRCTQIGIWGMETYKRRHATEVPSPKEDPSTLQTVSCPANLRQGWLVKLPEGRLAVLDEYLSGGPWRLVKDANKVRVYRSSIFLRGVPHLKVKAGMQVRNVRTGVASTLLGYYGEGDWTTEREDGFRSLLYAVEIADPSRYLLGGANG